jgi:hypothetical protein
MPMGCHQKFWITIRIPDTRPTSVSSVLSAVAGWPKITVVTITAANRRVNMATTRSVTENLLE